VQSLISDPSVSDNDKIGYISNIVVDVKATPTPKKTPGVVTL